ncbi:MAG: hypothetical protein ACUVXA_06020 [Candidatus Jordarchaeum sp.]|uniref:hypothetical protein n=1 Tax=Candidatus Jordarchaeum sp. TaxID=2823881 RepID=UPI00404B5BD3
MEEALKDYEENLKIQNNINQLKEEMEETWQKINTLKKEIQEEYEKSKPTFDQITQLAQKRDELRNTADIHHKNYIEIFQKIIQYENQLTKIEEEISLYKTQQIKLARERREREQQEKRKKEETIIQNKVKEAQEKLEKKKRVTLQELKLAMGEQ